MCLQDISRLCLSKLMMHDANNNKFIICKNHVIFKLFKLQVYSFYLNHV